MIFPDNIAQDIQQASDWFNRQLPDGGPVYAETDLDRLIVEPWNAFSSLLILIPAAYWFWKIHGRMTDFKFLLFAIPLVILGGIGSSLFHGFRASVVFLVMDVLPSALLTLSISIYFWIKLLKKWWYIFFIIIPLTALRFVIFGNVEGILAINLSYFLTGVMIGLPLLLILYKTHFYKVYLAAGAIGFFILALTFRGLDAKTFTFLPMGTHFLWHTFSAFGAWFMLSYLYYFRILPHRKEELSLIG